MSGAYEAGADVPTVILVYDAAAEHVTPRVPAAAEAHPARSLCAHRRSSVCVEDFRRKILDV